MRAQNRVHVLIAAQESLLTSTQYVHFVENLKRNNVHVTGVCTSDCTTGRFQEASVQAKKLVLNERFLISVLMPRTKKTSFMHSANLDQAVFTFIQKNIFQPITPKGEQP